MKKLTVLVFSLLFSLAAFSSGFDEEQSLPDCFTKTDPYFVMQGAYRVMVDHWRTTREEREAIVDYFATTHILTLDKQFSSGHTTVLYVSPSTISARPIDYLQQSIESEMSFLLQFTPEQVAIECQYR